MDKPVKLMTLDEFTFYEIRNMPHVTGELSGLIRCIGLASKRINAEIARAGLADILGASGRENIQGEVVQKLDDFAHETFIKHLNNSIYCAGVCSEESEDITIFDDPLSNNSKYVLMLDPLDGSSNIDVNITIGTIFSVLRRTSPLGAPAQKEDFLQPGNQIVAAGYIIYGSSTMLVYGTRRNINGFTLDSVLGEYCLSHPNLQCPPRGIFYSANHANFERFSIPIQLYLKSCELEEGENSYSERYTGSLVADVHRNLIKGGIFIYPPTAQQPLGKLRLQYECNPLAFILSVAGGYATNGFQNILDVTPTSYHQRSPLFIGSSEMMDKLMGFINNT